MTAVAVPIGQAVGKTIRCPECGAAAPVSAGPPSPPPSTQPTSLGVRTHRSWSGAVEYEVVEVPGPAPGSSAAAWYMVDCPRTGRKLYPDRTLVEIAEESPS